LKYVIQSCCFLYVTYLFHLILAFCFNCASYLIYSILGKLSVGRGYAIAGVLNIRFIFMPLYSSIYETIRIFTSFLHWCSTISITWTQLLTYSHTSDHADLNYSDSNTSHASYFYFCFSSLYFSFSTPHHFTFPP